MLTALSLNRQQCEDFQVGISSIPNSSPGSNHREVFNFIAELRSFAAFVYLRKVRIARLPLTWLWSAQREKWVKTDSTDECEVDFDLSAFRVSCLVFFFFFTPSLHSISCVRWLKALRWVCRSADLKYSTCDFNWIYVDGRGVIAISHLVGIWNSWNKSNIVNVHENNKTKT